MNFEFSNSLLMFLRTTFFFSSEACADFFPIVIVLSHFCVNFFSDGLLVVLNYACVEHWDL